MPATTTPEPFCRRPMPASVYALTQRALAGQLTTVDMLWAYPELILRRAGMAPDRWQAETLRSAAQQILLLCSRQVGKTEVGAALALRTALVEAPALVLVLSPSQRQSAEFLARVKNLYHVLTGPPRKLWREPQSWYDKMLVEAGKDDVFFRLPEKQRESLLQLHLANGSRIIGLPASEGKIRVYSSVALLLIDEASRVPDDLYRAVRPMLAVSRGRLVALSTPFGKRGWFFEEWSGANPWKRVKIIAEQCPRIPKEFLEQERLSLGERWFRQEYLCSFEDVVDAVFSYADIQAALSDDVKPLFTE